MSNDPYIAANDTADATWALKGEAERIADDLPSLRDRFAMAAMQGLITIGGLGIGTDSEILRAELAERSYKMADAMLAARGE